MLLKWVWDDQEFYDTECKATASLRSCLKRVSTWSLILSPRDWSSKWVAFLFWIQWGSSLWYPRWDTYHICFSLRYKTCLPIEGIQTVTLFPTSPDMFFGRMLWFTPGFYLRVAFCSWESLAACCPNSKRGRSPQLSSTSHHQSTHPLFLCEYSQE